MDQSCSFSFWDLYTAAYGKAPSIELKKKFMSLSQNEINRKVRKWAHIAEWKTEERMGTDKKLYLAFFP